MCRPLRLTAGVETIVDCRSFSINFRAQKRMARRCWISVWVLLAAVATIAAQQSRPVFEVASVKRQAGPLSIADMTAGGARTRALPGGRFEASKVTVGQLVWFAYSNDLTDFQTQITGWPDWVRGDQFLFAVSAKAAKDASGDEMRLMVRSLLEDRFKLVAHLESRQMQLQALVLARPNGTLGPRLFRMQDECSAPIVNELRRKFPEKYTGSGINMCSTSGVNSLAAYLTFRLKLPIIDATGLEGPFYSLLSAQFPPLSSILGRALNDQSDLPALSTALEEQLGLKLQSRRGPLKVLVIDSVEQPTPD